MFPYCKMVITVIGGGKGGKQRSVLVYAAAVLESLFSLFLPPWLRLNGRWDCGNGIWHDRNG